MKFEIVSLIITFSSLTGMVIIIWRKIPLLASLKEGSLEEFKESIWFKVKSRFLNFSFVKKFNFLLFLQKILSKIRILALKIENRISVLLHILRQKSRGNSNFQNSNYWQRLKNKNNDKEIRNKK